MTMDRPSLKGEGKVFANPNEALMAYDFGVIVLQARIKVRLGTERLFAEPGKETLLEPSAIIQTTVGRIIFNDVLPERLRFKNYAMKKENLRQIIGECFKFYGRQQTADLADAIKRLGFTYATRAGASVAISDVVVPPEREEILREADERITQLEEDYREGFLTDIERYRAAVGVWTDATDKVQKKVQEVLDPYGTIYTIANSGATKAKFQQIRQLSGMRGLMADPSGRIMEMPMRGNFRDGLNVMEYFISSHGARKGLADTALRTAESGYLTRRLIDVSQDVIVLEEDCGTTQGMWITQADSQEMNEPFRNRLIGRILQREVPGFEQVAVGTELDDDTVDAFIAADVQQVYVPLDPAVPDVLRRLPHVLRAQPGGGASRRYRRRGGHHRGAVHRRAGHAADDAYLPHRRHRWRAGRHHAGSAARRGALRVARAQGKGDHQRDRRRGQPHRRG